MSKVTEALVLLWENQDSDDLSDALVLHFKNHDRWSWRDVADEGLRVYNLMFQENVERYSPLDSLIGNVAAAAADGVFSAIAAAMGVKKADLECAVSRWYDDQDLATPAIGLERLRQMLPKNADPSWEHVVLGRLYHERIVHGFQDARYPAIEMPEPDVEPDICGLDPADMTTGDAAWTWREAVGQSEHAESKIAVDNVIEALARAG